MYLSQTGAIAHYPGVRRAWKAGLLLRLRGVSGACWVQVALSASPSRPAAHNDTLTRAACTSARPCYCLPQLPVHCLEGGRPPLTARVLQLFTTLLRQPLLIPSCLSAGLPKPMQTATTVIFFYLSFNLKTDQAISPPNQRTAPSILCSKIYSYTAQNQTDASMRDKAKTIIFLLCFDNLTFISIFL